MDIKYHLQKIYVNEEWKQDELDRLFMLMELFYRLPPPPDPLGIHSAYKEIWDNYHEALQSNNSDRIETSFLQLYCNAHGHEAPYTKNERTRMNETGGYWCHAGGISPLLKAQPWISKKTISADFGAGNGIQGLLLQWLYPHKKTVNIEISSNMIESGKALQKWLSIPDTKIQWIQDDILNQSARNYTFIYMYRPLKPEGIGNNFYQTFANDVAQTSQEVIIFSIADCLKKFLPRQFQKFYDDGHLTCFRKS